MEVLLTVVDCADVLFEASVQSAAVMKKAGRCEIPVDQ